MTHPTLKTTLLELATEQHGVVAVHQARTLGSRHQVLEEFARAHWRSELPLVFGVAGAPRTPNYWAMVRLLRAGPGAVVSHHSALWLWDILPFEQLEPFHITRMRGANGSKLRGDGIFAHETRKMPGAHVTSHLAFPIATPARALADVAATTAIGRVERWLDKAWTRRLVNYDALRRVLDDLNKRGRRGIRPLAALVERRGRNYVAPESGLEGRLNTILERAGLPGVRRQVEVGGESWLGRVDFLLGTSRLIVEVQSDTYHWSLTSADADRRRTAAMVQAGFHVLPIWESEVWSKPEEIVRAIETAMSEIRR